MNIICFINYRYFLPRCIVNFPAKYFVIAPHVDKILSIFKIEHFDGISV